MGSSKPLERLLNNLPSTIKHQERSLKKRKRRPSGLHNREALERELLETNIRLLKSLTKRFASRLAKPS